MRLPIIIALIVVITLPKDIHGFVDDVTVQLRVATTTVGKMLKHGDAIQVAEAKVVAPKK